MKKGIFPTEKRGIDLNGGRKANILGSMAKKASLSFSLQKSDSQPFLGHSIVQSDLSSSNIFQDSFKRHSNQEISTETIRKMIKEQIQESMIKDNSNNKIETLHKSLDYLSKSTISLVDEKTKLLRKEFNQSLNQQQTNIFNNMKLFIGVMTKETQERFSKQFVPNSFVEDIEKQLEYFEDRFDRIEKAPLSTSFVRRSAKQMVDQQIQNMVSRSLREMESLKKMVTQFTQDKARMEAQISSLNKIVIEISHKHAEKNAKADELAKKTTQNFEIELTKVKRSLEESSSKTIKCIRRIGSKQSESKSPSPTRQSKLEKENEDTGENTIPSLSGIDEPSVASIVMGASIMDESYRVNSSPYVNKNFVLANHNSLLCSGSFSILGDQLETMKLETQESVELNEDPMEQKEQKQSERQESAEKLANEIPNQRVPLQPKSLPVHLYQIDEEGFLQDEQGQYIENQRGELIVLSSEQINTLKTSELLITDQ